VAKVPSRSILFDHEAELDLASLASGSDPAAVDPNHHLWRNGRLWWIAFTVHRGYQQERVRFSLGTADVVEARGLRDRALALFEQARDCKVSLRFVPRRAAEVRS
jgi:hypothetical protein